MTTYKQKLESQISFAEKKRASYPLREHLVEQSKWDGYIQGLRYALAEYKETQVREINNIVQVNSTTSDGGCLFQSCKCFPVESNACGRGIPANQCQCDHEDLQPLGECICGASKVAPV